MSQVSRSTAWIFLVAALLASSLAIIPRPATASVGDGGSYVAVAPTRIANTATTTGFGSAGSFNANQTRLLTVTGVAGVPTTNVGAVVIDIAASSTANSRIYTYSSDETRGLAALSLKAQAGFDSTTIVVRPGPDGKIKIYNELGTTELNVDIQGYFTETSTDSTTGGFVPIKPSRMVDTTSGVGISTKLAASTSYTVEMGGVDDIPANAVGIFANVRAQNATAEGGLRVTASNATPSYSTPVLLNFDAGSRYDTGAAIALGPDGKFKVFSGASTDLVIDVQGYFTAGTGGGSFHPLSNTRVWDSYSSSAGAIAPGEKRVVDVTGLGGVPVEEVGSVALGITIKGWSNNGSVSVYNADLPDANGTANVSFTGTSDGGVARQSTSFVDLNGSGELVIANNSTNSDITVALNAQGWISPETEKVGTPDLDAMEPIPCASGTVCQPALVSGLAEGDVQNVFVSASPAASESSTAASNVEYELVNLTGAIVSTSGKKFTVRIDPVDLPASIVKPDGSVSLYLDVVTADGVTNTTAEAMAVKKEQASISAKWADPAGWDPSYQHYSTAQGAGRVTARDAASTYDTVQDDTTYTPETDGAKVAVGAPTSSSAAYQASGGPPRLCKMIWLDYYKKPTATLAATYPADGARGNFYVSGSSGSSYGATVSADNQVWKASASADYFKEGTWAKTFKGSTKAQKYTTVIEYRKRKKDCNDDRLDVWYYLPNKDTGALQTAGATRPNYTQCSKQTAGVFERNSTKGKAYELSGGVKLSTWLGVDARLKRQYSSTQKLVYKNPNTSLFCGNNDYPTLAGSVMMKK